MVHPWLIRLTALLSHGVVFVEAGHWAGHYNKRFLDSNNTITGVASSSPIDSSIPASSTSTSAAAKEYSLTSAQHASYTHPPSTITSFVESASPIYDKPWSSESGLQWSGLNLGSITTLPRPTLAVPDGPEASPTSSIPSQSTHTTLLNSTTISSSLNATTGGGWNWNLTTAIIPPPFVTETIVTFTPTSSPVPTDAPPECSTLARGGGIIVTSFSIVYTTTVTWTGDPADYTPPFAPISIPRDCTARTIPTGGFTMSVCDGSGRSCTLIHTSSLPPQTSISEGGDMDKNPYPTVVPAPTADGTMSPETITSLTTDKNPAVVFPSQTLPSYGGTPAQNQIHPTVKDAPSGVQTPEYGGDTPEPENTKQEATPVVTKVPAADPVTMVVQPGEVIINEQTVTDNPAQITSTVVVDDNTFVIGPSEVVGAGVTVTRPPPSAGGVFVSPPRTTTVDGVQVVYGSTVAVVDGSTFTVAATPTSAVVRGHTILLSPDGIVIAGQTLPVATGTSTASPNEIAVMGGELITAIGSDLVVIEGTTITYGAVSGVTTTFAEVIDNDTILIGPSGVVVHGETLGGPNAAPTVTTYEIVGGATITQLGTTAVVIDGITYSVGSGAPSTTTTVVGGETVTIGPDGVVAASAWTLAPSETAGPTARASTTTITPAAGGGHANNAAMSVPTATESAESRAAPSTRRGPDSWGLGLILCSVATGVGILGPLI